MASFFLTSSRLSAFALLSATAFTTSLSRAAPCARGTRLLASSRTRPTASPDGAWSNMDTRTALSMPFSSSAPAPGSGGATARLGQKTCVAQRDDQELRDRLAHRHRVEVEGARLLALEVHRPDHLP